MKIVDGRDRLETHSSRQIGADLDTARPGYANPAVGMLTGAHRASLAPLAGDATSPAGRHAAVGKDGRMRHGTAVGRLRTVADRCQQAVELWVLDDEPLLVGPYAFGDVLRPVPRSTWCTWRSS
jgi:hypothetical protein